MRERQQASRRKQVRSDGEESSRDSGCQGERIVIIFEVNVLRRVFFNFFAKTSLALVISSHVKPESILPDHALVTDEHIFVGEREVRVSCYDGEN